MSWYTKGLTLLTLVIFTVQLHAARITFQNGSEKASLETKIINSNSGMSTVEGTLQVPSIDVTDTRDGFNQVETNGLYKLGKLGAPELSTTGQLLAVPAGFEPVLQVVGQQVQTVPGVMAGPAQLKTRCDCANSFRMNQSLYRSEGLYPASNVLLEEAGNFRGVRLVRVAYYPVQQNFAKKELVVTTAMKVRISFRPTGRAATISMPKSMLRIVSTSTVNGSDLLNFTSRGRDTERMLIFTADSLKDTVQPLVQWKRERGFVVDVVTFTEGGGSKEKVKEYIQKEYNNGVKPTYLVFVGNKKTMPGFMEETKPGSAATDHTYALLEGDEKDFVPDAFYGRVLADNEAEANHQIRRWIEYEKAPEAKATWYHDGVTIASSGQLDGPSDKEYAEMVREGLTKGTYKDFAVFLEKEDTAKAADIIKALDSGRSWLSYFGHGDGKSWGSTNDTFDNKTVEKVKNGGKLPVIIDVACLNASWVNIAKPFGKVWVNHSNGDKEAGAVAYYGGSVSISWDPPAVMSVGIAKAHFEKPVSTLGGSVLAGQLHLMEKMGTDEEVSDNFKWYNLFGDPSLLIRTDVPKSYSVGVQVEKDEGRTAVDTTVTDEDGNALKGVTVSLTDGETFIGSALTNDSGKAVVHVDGELPSNAQVTVTGYNVETQSQSIN